MQWWRRAELRPPSCTSPTCSSGELGPEPPMSMPTCAAQHGMQILVPLQQTSREHTMVLWLPGGRLRRRPCGSRCGCCWQTCRPRRR
jgi:hypothetical protein